MEERGNGEARTARRVRDYYGVVRKFAEGEFSFIGELMKRGEEQWQ